VDDQFGTHRHPGGCYRLVSGPIAGSEAAPPAGQLVGQVQNRWQSVPVEGFLLAHFRSSSFNRPGCARRPDAFSLRKDRRRPNLVAIVEIALLGGRYGQTLAAYAVEEKFIQFGNVGVQGQFHRPAGGGFVR
jgi:hypothetical protein